MNSTVLTIIGSVLACFLAVWKYVSRKNRFRREQAEQAQRDLDNAIKNDSASDFLDAFGGMR